MADTTVQTQPATDPAATGRPADASPPTDPEDRSTWDEPKWQHFAKKHEADNKRLLRQLQEREAKDKEREDAEKSDAQKAADKAALAEKTAADAQLENMRLRVAMRKGLTETQARHLIGTTEQELEADADETFPSEDAAANGGRPTRPTERLRPGATSAPVSDNPNQVINDRIRQAVGKRT